MYVNSLRQKVQGEFFEDINIYSYVASSPVLSSDGTSYITAVS
jgi:hypothetical protein